MIQHDMDLEWWLSYEYYYIMPKLDAAVIDTSSSVICFKKPTRCSIIYSHICIRYLIVGLTAFACFLEFMLRGNLNVAIVSMVNHPHVEIDHHLASAADQVCPANELLNSHANGNETREGANVESEFDWSPSAQGIVLGAFYYGYIVTQIPAGRLAEVVGGKWLCGLGVLLSVVVNFLTPLAARIHIYALVVCRFVLGLTQGVVWPACFALFAAWVPFRERSLCFSLLLVGGNLGSVITVSITGLLCENIGWPSAFYVTSCIGCVWCVIWFLFVKSDPQDHPFISDEELAHIKSSSCSPKPSGYQSKGVPWCSILSSYRVWALIVAKFCGNWAYLNIAIKLPAYLEQVLHVPISKNGFFNSLLYMGISITLTTSGYVSELMIKRGWLKRTATRKVFEGIALFGCAGCLILIPEAGCNQILVSTLLVAGMFLYGFIGGGNTAIPAEMTSEYPATLCALTNMIQNTTGFLTPWVSGLILEASTDIQKQWNIIFYTAAALDILGGLAFCFFCSASQQNFSSENLKETQLSSVKIDSSSK